MAITMMIGELVAEVRSRPDGEVTPALDVFFRNEKKKRHVKFDGKKRAR